ncbi:MAG: CRISPR-associated endoribonuclease Cas6 [Bacillota bacterium]
MRLRIRFGDEDLAVQICRRYNHFVQSAIYSALPGPVSEFFHNTGYSYGKRAFKMITFSRLLGTCTPEGDVLKYTGPIRLVVCSPSERFCNSLATSLLQLGGLKIGKTFLPLSDVTVESIPDDLDTVKVRTLSPVVAYSTLFRPEGAKYTCYFSPDDPEFVRIVSENAIKKLVAFGVIDRDESEKIKGLQVSVLSTPRKSITYFKGTLIKAYDARLSLSGDPRVVKIVLEAGLGSKNAQGFGCLDLVAQGT